MQLLVEKFIFRKHLEDGEEIHFVAHKHWIAVFKPMIQILIFGFSAPWLLYMLFTTSVMLYFALAWSLGAFVKFIYELTDWYCDAWLVTSMGVIDLEWKGIFKQSSSRIEYPSIEGISYEFDGFWQTIMRFGSTQIDKVSSSNPNLLDFAHNPKRIELQVLQFKNQFEEEKGRTESSQLKELLSNIVINHIKKEGLDEESGELGAIFAKPGKKIQIEDLDKIEV